MRWYKKISFKCFAIRWSPKGMLCLRESQKYLYIRVILFVLTLCFVSFCVAVGAIQILIKPFFLCHIKQYYDCMTATTINSGPCPGCERFEFCTFFPSSALLFYCCSCGVTAKKTTVLCCSVVALYWRRTLLYSVLCFCVTPKIYTRPQRHK